MRSSCPVAAVQVARADAKPDGHHQCRSGRHHAGQRRFLAALPDFGSNDISQALGQLVDGFDDYSLSPA
jgi:hypothetical protein